MKLTESLLGGNGLSISRKTIAALLRELGPDTIVWEDQGEKVRAGILSRLVEEGDTRGIKYAAHILRRARRDIQQDANPEPIYRLITPSRHYESPTLSGLALDVIVHYWGQFLNGGVG
jgi:hypothetical protein